MVIMRLGLQFEVRRRSGSARGAGAGRGCAGATSADCRGAVVVSLALPAIVVGLAPHSASEEVAVFLGGADQRMILDELRCRWWRRFNLRECLFKQPLDGRTHVLVTVDAVLDGVRTSQFDQACRILPAQPDNAPHRALSVKHLLAQCLGLRADAAGAR